MRSVLARQCLRALAFAVTLLALLGAAPQIGAQGGEPPELALRVTDRLVIVHCGTPDERGAVGGLTERAVRINGYPGRCVPSAGWCPSPPTRARTNAA